MSVPKSVNSLEKSGNARREEEINLARLLSTFWRKKWIIIVSSVASALVALIIALFLTATYTGRGTLIIKQGQGSSALSNLLSESGGLAGALLGSGGVGNIQNEIKIMESRSLAERLTDSLIAQPIMKDGRLYPILWEEWPSDSVLVKRRTIVGRLLEQLEFAIADQTSIIEVFTDSPSPYEARALSNLAMQTYQELSLEQSQDLRGTTVEYLAEEQEQLQDSLAHSEEALRNFMKSNEVVDLKVQTEQQIQQYAQMTGQRYDAQAQVEAVNAAIDEYQSRLNDIKPGLAEKLAEAIGGTIQNLQFQISELETKRALIYSRNPRIEGDETIPAEIANIKKQIQELQQRVKNQTERILQTNDEYVGLLAENSASVINTITEYTQQLIKLRVERLQYRARIEALNEQIAQKEEFFSSMPENSLQMVRLKRQVEVFQEIYLMVTKQLAQARLQAKSEMTNSRVLDQAILPTSPSFPNYWLFVAVGFFLGGMISVIFVTGQAFMDDTVDNVQFLEQHGYRVIEIEGVQDKLGLGFLAEILISQFEQFEENSHAILAADATNRNLKSFLTNLIAIISAKTYVAQGIVTNGKKTQPVGEEDNVIEVNSLDMELKPIVVRKSEESDILIIGGAYNEGIQENLSIARLSDSSWIIATAGVTKLSSIKTLEKHIKTIKGEFKGVILMH